MTTPTDSALPPARPHENANAAATPGLDAGATAQRQRQRLLLATRARHWQRTRRLTMLLLAVWLATTFCSVFFARELTGLSVFGWPLSFYLAAQGAALIYLAIIGVYALCMRRFDVHFGHQLGQDGAAVAPPPSPPSPPSPSVGTP